MERSEVFNLLKGITLGIAKFLGPDTEVVLHDLEKGEMVYSANGHITGRKPGYHLDRSVCDVILDLADEDGHVIGYGSTTAKGERLRSSHFVIKDENGENMALICINQDIGKLQELKSLLDSMVSITPLTATVSAQEEQPDYIQKVTRQVIIDAIEKMKPTPIDTREGRMEILRKLDVQGVFSVKDAVPQVCKLLSISQATLYNYLREIRTQSFTAASDSIGL